MLWYLLYYELSSYRIKSIYRKKKLNSNEILNVFEEEEKFLLIYLFKSIILFILQLKKIK